MKLFENTLKSPNGKWSRKSLTLFVSFVVSIILGVYIVSSDFILDKEINKYAIELFKGFMILVASLKGATVVEKFTPLKKQEEEA
jgi:hypothetical protein